MGGGISREGFFGRRAGSQPYAPSYKVVPEMLREDRKDPDVYNPKTGYFKNPSAVIISAETAHNNAFYSGEPYIRKNQLHGYYEYVIDMSGHLIVAKRDNPNDSNKRSPHPTLVGGRNPPVRCAGIIHFQAGKIDDFNGDSGHYRPAPPSLNVVMDYLEKVYVANPRLFYWDSPWKKKWRKKYGK